MFSKDPRQKYLLTQQVKWLSKSFMYFKICLNNQQYTFQKGPKDIRYILLLNLICSCTHIYSFVIVFSQRATPNNPSTKQNFLRCQRPDPRRQQSKLDLRHSGWRQSRSSRLATGCRRCCSRTRIVFRVDRWRKSRWTRRRPESGKVGNQLSR